MSGVRIRRLSRPSSSERGAVLITVALLVTALFLIAALVIDLSVVRQNRQSDKSATDFAAAAGIRGMDDGSGQIDTWGGICTALDYLKANRPELSSLTAVDASDNPITPDPCIAPLTEYCVNSPADWREYVGLADGGDIRVTIAGGYDLSASGFSEDADAYAGDEGDDPCEHLAVIIDQRQDPFFGDVAGSVGWETTMRSVARLDVGTQGGSTAALVVLERTACKALEIEGSNASISVLGNVDRPGIIHADSDGSTCSGSERILSVAAGVATPSIKALMAETPSGGEQPGIITSVALTGDPPSGTESSLVASNPPTKVCAQVTASDCTGSTGGLPTENDFVGRAPADDRYLTHIRTLRDAAQDDFDLSASQAIAAFGSANVFSDSHPDAANRCDQLPEAPTAITLTNVWTDCTNVGERDRTFTGMGTVVIAAALTNDNFALAFNNPARLYIEGTINQSGGNILINHGGESSCTARYSSEFGARTKMVVGGSLITSGGTLRMCQTTVLMSDDSDPSCEIPLSSGTLVSDGTNTCIGRIETTGQSQIDWSAPNVNNATQPSVGELEHFEDLAFWTETSGVVPNPDNPGEAPINKLQGVGGITLTGIFFTPNAKPFRIAGNGVKNTDDAQFFTRRLQVAGQGHLTMKPDPANALQIKVLGGYTLVR